MIKPKTWLTSIILIIFDVTAIYAIFRLATLVRQILSPFLKGPPFQWVASEPVAQLGIFFLLMMFFLQGLYPGYGLTAVKELEQMGRSISLAFILLATISYLVKSFQIFPRSILLIAWGISIIILPLMHFLVRNILSRQAWYGVPVTVFGDEGWREEVVETLKRVRRLGWKPQAVLAYSEIPRFGQMQDRARLAIVAPVADTTLENYIRLLNQHFRKVLIVRQTDNFGSLWVEPRDLDGYLGLEFHYHLLVRRNRWIKRWVDVVGSGFLLLLLSPLLALLTLLVWLDSPGPVFFRQERLGKNFQRFHVLKFRSMLLGAEEKLQQLLEKDPIAKAQYDEFHKLENDPRVTRVGNFLRKYSLDELPQLWNVLKDEMSLSGPRAYMPSELESMGTYAATILRVNPGMTGWWQVLGRHNTSFQKRLEMDEYYISNWSLWMDAYIFLKTVWVVIKGDGA
jgi:Undecaprenyl-phosphate galactose phosphotransferase WbaP